jgi:hypothetical protein
MSRDQIAAFRMELKEKETQEEQEQERAGLI